MGLGDLVGGYWVRVGLDNLVGGGGGLARVFGTIQI